jgi:hypothetical protein
VALRAEGSCVFERPDGGGVVFMQLSEVKQDLSVIKGQTEPFIQGWISRRYGERSPAPVLSCSVERVGAWSQAYLLIPFKEEADAKVLSACDGHSQTGVGWTISGTGVVDRIVRKTDQQAFDIRTDSDFSLLRSRDGDAEYIFVTEGTTWEWDEEFILNGQWKWLEVTLDWSCHQLNVRGVVTAVQVTSSCGWKIGKQDWLT